jgi:hypothetical protein
LSYAQVVTVNDSYAPAAQPRRNPLAQRRHHGREPLGTAAHQRLHDGRFDTIDLVVERGHRDGQVERLLRRSV